MRSLAAFAAVVNPAPAAAFLGVARAAAFLGAALAAAVASVVLRLAAKSGSAWSFFISSERARRASSDRVYERAISALFVEGLCKALSKEAVNQGASLKPTSLPFFPLLGSTESSILVYQS
jgi:hypothetical protein